MPDLALPEATRSLTAVATPTKPVSGKFLGNPGVRAVISWTTPGTAVEMAGAAVRNPNGGLVASLTGKAPKRHHQSSPKVETLHPSVVSGSTFRTVTIPRPKHGSTISIRVAQPPRLAEPTIVTVQLSPIEALPQGSATAPPTATTVPPPPPPNPTPPLPPSVPASNHLEQETPNHPVNTFTNYHNASGMGPDRRRPVGGSLLQRL